ncbi:MAG TPA: low affinity iron permease family protein [Dehalococcoidia bacterium]|jgi:low affinity Fe/Cu permease
MTKKAPEKPQTDRFRAFARWVSNKTGSAGAFLAALAIVVVWAVTGPLFAFSDTWQLVINTGTTIVTFLMVFLIQNTQNRDSAAIHTKIDELLVATRGARNSIAVAEELSDQELTDLKDEFQEIARAEGRPDNAGTGTADEGKRRRRKPKSKSRAA